MSQKRCGRCGTIVKINDRFCPTCGSSEFTGMAAEQTPPYQSPTTPSASHPIGRKQSVSGTGLALPRKGLKWWQIALIGLGALLPLLLLIGLLGDNEPSTGGYTSGGENTYLGVAADSKTVMIYLVGSDLESQTGAASLDIQEMLGSGVDTAKHNVLIYTGGAKEWTIEDIPVDKNCIYRLERQEFTLVKEYDAANMGDSKTLAEFVSYGLNNYLTDEYGLILWNHGAGPMIGYGHDELHEDLLQMDELQAALSEAGLGEEKKLEFLGFDACLMGSIETAWEIRDYAKYFIASQEVEPGCGWDYGFLKQLDHYDGGKDIGKCIVDAYIADCEALARDNPAMDAELTLSCMDLSKIEQVEQSMNALFAKVDANMLNGYFPTVSQHRNNVKSFGKYSSDYDYDLIDVSHLVALLAGDYASEAGQVEADLKEFVCYTKSNVQNASGVSIYHPYDNTEQMTAWTARFKEIGFAEKYAEYITNFGKLLANPSVAGWKSFAATKGTATKDGANRELTIQLNEEQVKNYAGANYYVLKKINDSEYLFVFGGYDTKLDANGVVSASYNNKAVFAVNDQDKSVSDAPITMYQVDDGSGEQKYCATALFWYLPDKVEDFRTDPVEWMIKIDNGTPKLQGAYLIDNPVGEEIPQRQLLNYKDYTTVEFSFSTRTPKRDANGNLLPYFEWDSTGKFYGNEYNVKDGFHLECREIDNKEGYFVMFVVKDVQGNRYASEMFALPK